MAWMAGLAAAGGLLCWASYRRGWHRGMADGDALQEYARRETAARVAADLAIDGALHEAAMREKERWN